MLVKAIIEGLEHKNQGNTTHNIYLCYNIQNPRISDNMRYTLTPKQPIYDKESLRAAVV